MKLGRILSALALVALFATAASADLILYDSMDYTGDMVGQGAGSGSWTGNWMNVLGGSGTSPAAGLSFDALQTDGGAAATQANFGSANTYFERTFDKGTYFDNGDTVWMSILFQRSVSNKKFNVVLKAGTGADYIGAGLACDNASNMLEAAINGTGSTVYNTNFNNDETVFAVVRISIGASITGAGHHAVDLWMNPDPSADLSSVAIGNGDAFYSRAYSGLTGADRVGIVAHNDQAMTYDELRVGTTWADVSPVPEPATMALLGLGSIVALIRRKR